jgi:hypothetical protein
VESSAESLRMLDCRIGSAVLGYHVESESEGFQRYYVLLDGKGGIVARQTSTDDGGRASEAAAWNDCPPFSSDFAVNAAMLGALEQKFPGIEIVYPSAPGPDARYTALLHHQGREVSGVDGSMEAAICRAVLAWFLPPPS